MGKAQQSTGHFETRDYFYLVGITSRYIYAFILFLYPSCST